MSTTDAMHSLQNAAQHAASHIARGHTAGRVVVYGTDGRKILDVMIPLGMEPPPEKQTRPTIGWGFTQNGATFGGKSIEVAASRLNLLRVLVEASESLTAKELTEKVFDSETDEANTRYHIRELKRELKAAFPGFEEEILEGGAEGYRLKLRR